LEAAQNALANLREEISTWDNPGRSGWVGCAEFENNFMEAVNNDLDMPKALAVMWDLVRSDLPTKPKHQSIFIMDRVLGLGLDKIEKAKLPEGAKELIEKREVLRKQGKFDQTDMMRSQLLEMGVEVEDTPDGPRWKIKR
jgi:cysteinyl-tRNA synthetase